MEAKLKRSADDSCFRFAIFQIVVCPLHYRPAVGPDGLQQFSVVPQLKTEAEKRARVCMGVYVRGGSELQSWLTSEISENHKTINEQLRH